MEFTFELPDSLIARLTAESERRQVPPAQIVQESLEKWLSNEQAIASKTSDEGVSLAEQMKDLIGCIDAETDLSTNPKYMEGFGKWRE